MFAVSNLSQSIGTKVKTHAWLASTGIKDILKEQLQRQADTLQNLKKKVSSKSISQHRIKKLMHPFVCSVSKKSSIMIMERLESVLLATAKVPMSHRSVSNVMRLL